jgi:hypothetical protein
MRFRMGDAAWPVKRRAAVALLIAASVGLGASLAEVFIVHRDRAFPWVIVAIWQAVVITRSVVDLLYG